MEMGEWSGETFIAFRLNGHNRGLTLEKNKKIYTCGFVMCFLCFVICILCELLPSFHIK